MVPEILQVGIAVAVKLIPVRLAPLTVTAWLVGLNVNPLLPGLTVYAPFTKFAKLKFPDASAVVVAVACPLNVTVAPLPPAAGLMVPEMVQVATEVAVKLIPLALAPLITTVCVV